MLEVYAEPSDPKRPKVNFDETNKQWIKETRLPLPAQPGQPQHLDYEYERNGTRNLFLFVEPPAGQRHVHVTEQRTKVDFAHEMQWLVDIGYPEAEVIRVVPRRSMRASRHALSLLPSENPSLGELPSISPLGRVPVANGELRDAKIRWDLLIPPLCERATSCSAT